MPRLLQLVALCLAILMADAPALLAEVLEDDCAEQCAGEESAGGCQEQGCGDCALLCSWCPRPHMIAPPEAASPRLAVMMSVGAAEAPSERLPVGPPPRGVFHPPRAG